ncbi:hypothetical protein B0H13DRAFT_2648923 [Mycena leptocephala]|nr:hypothetical protein B0H13DRAFT_2648923 [Mycena leptocephala]
MDPSTSCRPRSFCLVSETSRRPEWKPISLCSYFPRCTLRLQTAQMPRNALFSFHLTLRKKTIVPVHHPNFRDLRRPLVRIE